MKWLTVTALRVSEEKFRTFAESAPVSIMLFHDFVTIYANPAATKITGFTNAELHEHTFWDIVHPKDQEQVILSGEAYERGGEYRGLPFRIVTKSGAERWVDCRVEFIEFEGKPAQLVFAMDITQRKKFEEQLRQTLQEKEVLLQEIHHRVKNNMQVISSLLRLQAKHIQDPDLQSLFQASQNRIRTMSLVHEKLYQSSNLSRIPLQAYVKDLARHLVQIYDVRPDRVGIEVAMGNLELSLGQAIPCGLILNELISNAIKHGFPANQQGRIKITVTKTESRTLTLQVKDDGIGLEPQFRIEETQTLGLRLVKNLTEKQLRGTIAIGTNGSRGTLIWIQFKENGKPRNDESG